MKYHLLFSGHMIDAPGRKPVRFSAQWENHVAAAIRSDLTTVFKKHSGQQFNGIAGGACGGDILFHEACLQLGISSTLYLALPPAGFKKTSVSFAGKSWEKRFDALTRQLPVKVLFHDGSDSNSPLIWEKANEWMLKTALSAGGKQMMLLALWDGCKGDATGGTEHMVNEAKKNGATVQLIRPDPHN